MSGCPGRPDEPAENGRPLMGDDGYRDYSRVTSAVPSTQRGEVERCDAEVRLGTASRFLVARARRSPPRRCAKTDAYEGRVEDARLLSHPDRDARAAGQVVRAVSWIGDGNTVYARLGEASPCFEATLVDPDDLLADRRARLGDAEKSRRDYRHSSRPAEADHRPGHPHEISRARESWCHDRDTGGAPCRRRRRSGRRRAQEKDASDRDGNAEPPHEATLTHTRRWQTRRPESARQRRRKRGRVRGRGHGALRRAPCRIYAPGRLPPSMRLAAPDAKSPRRPVGIGACAAR
jgi:hypothetical protein